uniref:fimbrial protein n=1 Tax=Serratia proteamaculans TaxID=28151 RepID=UPI001F4C2960|nr:fimbrial protein [Serratia proteamaculans]
MACAYGATQKTETVNVNISGVIVSKPSCTISNSKTIEVNFGSGIGVNKVDGGNYRQPIPYTITCGDSTNSLQLTLKLTGNAVDFDTDNATVRTAEQSDLGVKIYQNGNPLALDKDINININSIPTLEALLVKRDGATLSEGEFNATATLRAEYQ